MLDKIIILGWVALLIVLLSSRVKAPPSALPPGYVLVVGTNGQYAVKTARGYVLTLTPQRSKEAASSEAWKFYNFSQRHDAWQNSLTPTN